MLLGKLLLYLHIYFTAAWAKFLFEMFAHDQSVYLEVYNGFLAFQIDSMLSCAAYLVSVS